MAQILTSEEFDLSDPEQYHDWTDITLRYGDEDRMGHINNASYVTFFEASRVPILDSFLDGDHIDFVMARMTTDYLRETSFPGVVRVGGRGLRFGTKSFTSGYGLFRDGLCLATAVSVNVFFDTKTRGSASPTPAQKSRVEEFMRTGMKPQR